MIPFNTLLVLNAMFIIGVNLCFCQCESVENSTIEQVFAVFRHGDRTNDLSSNYPKNPYINETYFPYGYGELINKGKKRMYNLGQTIRKLYNTFLGPLYLPGLLYSLSTDFSRTKNSLQLFLAGLFPPFDTVLEWNYNLNWNPIAFNYVSFQNNRELSFPLFFCPRYQMLYQAYKQSTKGLEIENRYQYMYDYISQESGLNVTSIFNLFGLFFELLAEKEWGLKQPEWTKSVFPSYLRHAAEDNYKLFIATPQLNQLFGGFLLKKTLRDINRKINGEPNQPKMYIYSGHELSVVSILGAMKLYYPHIPMYSACVLIELHNINQKRYVKVRYNKEVFNKFVNMQVPGCGVMCPLENFVQLLQENIPADGDPCII